MAVVDGLEEPERRLDPAAKLAVGDRADELPAGPAGNEPDLPEPVERQELVGEQADDRAGVVAPRAAARRPRTRDRRSRAGAPRAAPRSARPLPGPRAAAREASAAGW